MRTPSFKEQITPKAWEKAELEKNFKKTKGKESRTQGPQVPPGPKIFLWVKL